jgi:RsiW-degrading membrane proteinase PrsW (M82 family)
LSIAVILAAGIAPGIFWLWFFIRGRTYNPNPRRLVALTFALGALSTLPVLAVYVTIHELGLVDLDLPEDLSAKAGTAASLMFFVVGPVEEFFKFMAVRLGPFRSLHFDEPADGLVFGAAASLGFATLENITYAWQYGPEVMIVRGPVSTVAHVVFGSFWAVALARTRMERRGTGLVAPGLVAAALAHGAFNFFAVTGYGWVSVLMVIAGGFWVARLFRWGQSVSPYRLRRNVPKLSCPYCGATFRAGAEVCDRCGSSLKGVSGEATCGNCGTVSRPGARFCSNCGDRFVELK